MSTENAVLVALRSPKDEERLRKIVSTLGFRISRADDVESCRKLLSRRSFVCAFLHREIHRGLSRFSDTAGHTYSVIVATPESVRNTSGNGGGHIPHDCLVVPFDEGSVDAMIRRARRFTEQLTELEGLRSAAIETLRQDAALICTGKWASTAQKWLEKMRAHRGPLLLVGEAGSGKRLLSQYLHFNSNRGTLPFLLISCDSPDAAILQRELFGDIPPKNLPVRGPSPRNRFLLARPGTLVLDKVNRLPRDLQKRLALAVHSGRFSPAGGGGLLPVRAELILTVQEEWGKNSPLRHLQRDLAKLLRGAVLPIPPLRARTSDLPSIVQSVFEKLARDRGIRSEPLGEEALSMLAEHTWPGNIRELEGVLWAATVGSRGAKIDASILSAILPLGPQTYAAMERGLEDLVRDKVASVCSRFGVDKLKNLHAMVLESAEKPLLTTVLSHAQGNQLRAARALGINRNTLRKKLSQYGISN